MPDRRNPSFGSTDWAAKQFLRILDREEREKAARRTGLQTAQSDESQSNVPPIRPTKPSPPIRENATGSGLPSWRQDPRATGFIEEILSEEGMEANRPSSADTGGHTMRGITAGTLREWHRRHPGNLGTGPGQVPGNVSELTEDHALRILKEDVYDAYKLARITDDRLAHQLTDILMHTSLPGVALILPGVHIKSHSAPSMT